jgi:pyruvate dehydrogenase complex dehydrogenase (E1) component
MTNCAHNITPDELCMLSELERKVLWLASWTIHHANHLRDSSDGLKVGGHQASSASLATIMTALYFRTLRPQDRVAVKPHASPNYHAIQYLLGRQTQEKLANFRGYKGAQSRAPRTLMTSISPPAPSAWASRRRCSRLWFKTTCAPMAGALTVRKVA